MKLLFINAGAKSDGATQEILLSFRNAAPDGAETSILCLGDLKIGYCKGCKACYVAGACARRDDMDALIGRIDAADALIFAVPSYWGDVPGQFKVFIDRCTAYADTNPHPGRRKLQAGKKCFVIALRAGARPMECEHLIETVRHWCGHMGIEMTGGWYLTGIDGKADLAPHKAAIRAKADEWLNGI